MKQNSVALQAHVHGSSATIQPAFVPDYAYVTVLNSRVYLRPSNTVFRAEFLCKSALIVAIKQIYSLKLPSNYWRKFSKPHMRFVFILFICLFLFFSHILHANSSLLSLLSSQCPSTTHVPSPPDPLFLPWFPFRNGPAS